MRSILFLPATAVLLTAAPALAQYSDIGGANLDAAASIAGTAAMNSYLDDDDRSAAPTRRAAAKGSPERSRQTCANGRRMALAGDRRPQLGQLLRLCRSIGY